jgi:hypothetical protein
MMIKTIKGRGGRGEFGKDRVLCYLLFDVHARCRAVLPLASFDMRNVKMDMETKRNLY